MIALSVDFDEEIGFWYFVVREDDETLHFRPGFRTQELAQSVGDAWIKGNLGGQPTDQSEKKDSEP